MTTPKTVEQVCAELRINQSELGRRLKVTTKTITVWKSLGAIPTKYYNTIDVLYPKQAHPVGRPKAPYRISKEAQNPWYPGRQIWYLYAPNQDDPGHADHSEKLDAPPSEDGYRAMLCEVRKYEAVYGIFIIQNGKPKLERQISEKEFNSHYPPSLIEYSTEEEYERKRQEIAARPPYED